ncbi:BolA protein [Kalmanozyma brasiliensis GHG001]|uniref:Ribosomal protein L9 domain-containing protein n=1 Tax=Kalmanozyma brasiliensis (strain GHG001) TaxID=1365824 RepID=V5EXY6_KALBG|nr:BolA protein [Kalmanozyma brasiliensis GHG001]EST07469.1 BolA protein [Kalmanozyma brasiliensis GHG001]
MRSTAISNLAHTARTLSQRRLVRVQLKQDIEGLGAAGSIVLVQPGRMRNQLLPTRKAIYQPLPTPFQLSNQKLHDALVESQLASAHDFLEVQKEREAVAKELGPLQLLSLRRKLEAAPPVVFTRQTTTRYTSTVATTGEVELPKPAIGIQGSISTSDVVQFLRENGAFDLETDYSNEGKPVQLNRLTLTQINSACEFTLDNAAQGSSDSIDKLGRIKKTGRFVLVAHIFASNTRARIPVIVRPVPSSASASTPIASAPSASSSMSGQTRGYATSARPTSMESSMRTKLEAEFGPSVEVNIRNDSSKHAHHAAMAAQGGGNGETHFYVHVVSDKFQGMTQIKRHRAVNALLQGEFDRGLHALSLRTKTWAEEGKVAPTNETQQESTIDDPTTCPTEDTSSGSLWQAPQSTLHPTSPLAPSPPSTTTTDNTNDILSAFYTRPPSNPTIPVPRRSVSPQQREKFFRRATKDDALEPSPRQNLLNVLGGVLATACAGYMVFFADFGQPEGVENCFTGLRRVVWGEEGAPKLF